LIIRGHKETKGDIILQDELHLTGYELNDELREKQAKKIINMY